MNVTKVEFLFCSWRLHLLKAAVLAFYSLMKSLNCLHCPIEINMSKLVFLAKIVLSCCSLKNRINRFWPSLSSFLFPVMWSGPHCVLGSRRVHCMLVRNAVPCPIVESSVLA